MPIAYIRPIKEGLRQKYRQLRIDLDPAEKARRDETIARRVTSLWQYQRCRLFLVYVSTAIEVDTYRLIEQALADGKTVAVPRCVPGTRQMEFYRIQGIDELEKGMFGVLEPLPREENLIKDFSGSLCVVPAFSYDWYGFRLGYGKGYYDRFLSRYTGTMIGICYSDCVQRKLPHGRYDRPAELLVTERYLRRTAHRFGDVRPRRYEDSGKRGDRR
jgi:5-formyltetrahydrofolate cyclo-ligase